MQQLRLLIVEDSDDDAALLLEELARGGYDVTYRRVETLPELERALRVERWDLMISDFTLPGFTAMDSLRLIAEIGLDLPCIIISGSIEDEAAVGAMRAGARDFFAKDRMARLVPAVARELREADERRSLEFALTDARDRMRFSLEAAGVGTWEDDIVHGRVAWSAVNERLHGIEENSFGGSLEAFLATVHPDDRESVRTRIAASRRGASDSRVDYRVTWPDGSIHWIVDVGRTFYDALGRPIRAAGVSMDVTMQRNLEEQFHQAQKMESIGNLAGGIAHDFNNLLTAILGYSNVLLEELPGTQSKETTRSFLEEIRKAGERAAALTNQLLAFSRRQIIQPTVLNVNMVIGNIEPMLQRLIGEDIELTTRLAPHLGATRADAGQIEQVVMNLVVNARDAMPTGGKITIETANVDLDAAAATRLPGLAEGPHVVLTVTDTGGGMPPEIIARIFEPFFTTKPKGRGTGLGLATVYGIVTQNEGGLAVESEVNRGTTFRIYLKRAEAVPELIAAGPRQPPRGKGETVLLVEDDPRVRKLARRLLVRSGYAVIEAADAEDAVRLAADHAGHIDLLLTDVIMPGISGRMLAQRLSHRYPTLKVLYMSGYTDDAIVNHGVLSRDIAFLQKPFTPTTFGRAVREALDARGM
jgi:two-component system, cell cycle sensor histidine kinase and response regulator CckA